MDSIGEELLHDIALCYVCVYDGVAAPAFLWDQVDILRGLQQCGVQDGEEQEGGCCSDSGADCPDSPFCQLRVDVLQRAALPGAERHPIGRPVLLGDKTFVSICREPNKRQAAKDAELQALQSGVCHFYGVRVAGGEAE